MPDADREDVVHALVELAKRELSGEPPRSTVRALPDLRRRPERRMSLAGRLSFGFAAAAALATVLVWWFVRPATITYAVVSGTERAGVVVGARETRLLFSEGSQVLLEQGAETEVAELGSHGGNVRLRKGRARVSITPRSGAEWVVHAGPYAVRVTGTEFDVAWSDSARALEVSMHSGSVEVTGASLQSPIRLRAGQRLLQRGPTDTPLIQSVRPAASSEERKHPPEPLEEPTSAVDEAASSASQSPERLRAVESSWSRQVAQGKFEDVLRQAEQRGVDSVLARAPLSDLRALSDAARYSRRAGIAERALGAQRQRFSTSTAARDAAFLLGQLTESQGGNAALGWYDTYLREAPNGSYAPQAMGRKMMIVYRARGAAGAETVASEYLVRYPKGPYAAAARRIVAEARGSAQP